jgi:hypothetical protein
VSELVPDETPPRFGGRIRPEWALFGIEREAGSSLRLLADQIDVVGRSGEVTVRFSPDIVPEDLRLLATVDAALAN